jgi:hydroxymethylpyrimidine pyrophosphatase-like HAD family hydrolase
MEDMSVGVRMAGPVRMIAVDMDGTLIGAGGTISERNRAALALAVAAGVEVVVATGRRHSYAMKVLAAAELRQDAVLVSSNGAVVRTLGSELIERSHMEPEGVELLLENLREFRNALVVTFDKVGRDGDDARGALVVEELEDLHASIGRWMEINAPYIEQVKPIEDALKGDAPIQMMLCGTVERMRLAEARLGGLPGVAGVGETLAHGVVQLNRTEYPERDLSILDILPAGCSKGSALTRLMAARGIEAGELMAIGDNWNDLSMLEIAGRPVLMANAPEDLLGLAAQRGWQVGLTNLADGVAEAVEAALTVGTGGSSPHSGAKGVW